LRICIIIPTHQEEKRISETLKAYGNFFHYSKEDIEILIVINNTQDKTEEIVKNYQQQYPFIRYLNFKEGGKGFAIREGFKDALKTNATLIGFVDADLATSPEAFQDLINNIGDSDGIIASRYVKGAIVNPKQSIKRIIGSRMFNILVRLLFMMPISDTQCGAKLFRREAIEKVADDLSITQWAFDVNLLYKLRVNGFKIKEHPTIWQDKEYGHLDGKDFMNSGVRMVLACFRLRLINSKLNFIVGIYDKFPRWMKISYLIS